MCDNSTNTKGTISHIKDIKKGKEINLGWAGSPMVPPGYFTLSCITNMDPIFNFDNAQT